ncbi:cell envelope integrity protein TolA [Limnohabitans sp. MMS-10A-178]|uniref:cell envelope integrity protein TolA n=1 Tax=Limnohabitans sp. MMS-10A-178 TaxID=1835767 RepID=UPI000D3C76E7|nr:cell envelope integrity protein TolA [Limnohabitans sp. MMS-10A-178]PUE17481.1 protein TolA [Limnohabitans sp. MMS-10A-178]
MNAIAHNEFAPPPVGGFGRSLSFALFMHLLLLVAIAFSVQWKTEPNNLSASAELWSAVPVEAAPAANEPEPPPPEPVKAVEQKPEPPPPPPAAPKINAAAEREAADIALKKELEKKKLEEKKEAELEKKKKLEKDKLEKEKLDKEKAKEKEKEREKEKAKELEKKKKEEALKKAEAAAKAKEEAKKAAAEEKRTEALRNENLKRMQGMAGASGDEKAKGAALKSSGPSASYAGRIRARIKPNITFTEDVAGNPKAEVEVRTSTDGTILSRKLLSSSGNKAWDEAVLKAIDKTATLPRDEDGRVPPVLEISFRPKD